MAQPFDFGALLQDPAFVFGTNLLFNSGKPNAIGNAYGTVQKMQEMQQQKQMQQAQIQNMQEQRAAQQQAALIAEQRATIQAAAEARKQAHDEQVQKRQQQIMSAFPEFFGSPEGGTQPQPQSQPPLPPAYMGGGPQSSITPQLLDSLAQVESSGNPNAVNPQSGAQGLFQFMPATAKQMGINPMDPVQAREGAQRYLETLTQQHGGSLEKALAAYGGFKKKDPTAYIQKVLAGAGVQPTQQAAPGAPISAGNSGPNPGLRYQKGAVAMAALTGQGLPAAMSEYGKALAPQHVQPGYERDATGNMTYIQDPMKVAEVARDEKRIALEDRRATADEARAKATVDEKNLKATAAREGAISGFQEVTDSMDRLSKASRELLDMPGLESTTGWKGITKAYALTQGGRDTAAALETLQSKVAVDQLMKMKTLSANGASGFGALSGPELRLLETYQVNLSKATSLEARKKALKDLMDFAEQTKVRVRERVKGTYGEDAIRMPTIPDAPAAAAKLPSGWTVREK